MSKKRKKRRSYPRVFAADGSVMIIKKTCRLGPGHTYLLISQGRRYGTYHAEGKTWFYGPVESYRQSRQVWNELQLLKLDLSELVFHFGKDARAESGDIDEQQVSTLTDSLNKMDT